MKSLRILFVFTTLYTYAQWDANSTPSYPDLIAHYKTLAKQHKEIEVYAMGQSDYGEAIYLCIINGSGDSLRTFQKAKKGSTVLINNGIHPGEPDGINACLLWIDEWIARGKKLDNLPVIGIIPAYNVGGMYNRSSTSRANQEGPDEYGFRGNARNLDLNRDFIKMDSENTFTFARIFHALDPDVFIDNHVSNGADYQYTLTFIPSLKERLAPSLRKITYENCIPFLENYCLKEGTCLVPYIDLKGETPEGGLVAFNDLPRYTNGYASLFHTISFTVETHMLKPFPQRVTATKLFMENIIAWTINHGSALELARQEARTWSAQRSFYAFNYALQQDQKDSVFFTGYEASILKSEVTGGDRLFYDRTKPYQKWIPYFAEHKASDSLTIPESIVIRSSEKEVIRKLQSNHVEMHRIEESYQDSVVAIYVDQFQSTNYPYEGHYLHYNSSFRYVPEKVLLRNGDYIIPCKQDNSGYIYASLFPSSEDSFFAWNFFDSYLQQKEHFSSYVFEDKAKEILEQNSHLQKELDILKETDPEFANSPYKQLQFIYRNSEYFEKSFYKLPLFFIY